MKEFNEFRPHPWHGLSIGPNPPELVYAFIEITPFDLIKYEVDKVSGYLAVDRPQRTASLPPALYGFIPKTYCDEAFRALSSTSLKGDGDPLDICVISERAISRSEVIVVCRPIGGLQMVDNSEADDKIIAVLENDYVWGHIREVAELPQILLERLQHYFMTYKLQPGSEPRVKIESVYGRDHAHKVIQASISDYKNNFAKK